MMKADYRDVATSKDTKMTNPWDTPPRAEVGDTHADAIYIAVGHALSEWEHLESALGQLFAFLVGAEIVYPNNEPAMRAYGSVISFQGRASMLEEAAAGYFHTRPNEEFQSRFRKILSTECRQFSGRRNDIAHGRWQQAWQKNGQLGHFLMPGYQPSKHWKIGDNPSPKYLYTSKEIAYFRARFEDLYDEVAGLVNDMSAVQRGGT